MGEDTGLLPERLPRLATGKRLSPRGCSEEPSVGSVGICGASYRVNSVGHSSEHNTEKPSTLIFFFLPSTLIAHRRPSWGVNTLVCDEVGTALSVASTAFSPAWAVWSAS